MRISDWSSDVCSSDLLARHHHRGDPPVPAFRPAAVDDIGWPQQRDPPDRAVHLRDRVAAMGTGLCLGRSAGAVRDDPDRGDGAILAVLAPGGPLMRFDRTHPVALTRSEEHTSELQSLMRISYAVFCLINKIKKIH